VDRTTLDLAPLTLLAGANNAGKSSFLGALLAFCQSEQSASRHQLLLSGEWVDLGPFDELVSPDRDSFSIGIEGDVDGSELSAVWDFVETADRARPEARVGRIEASVGAAEVSFSVAADGSIESGEAASSQLLHPGALLRPTQAPTELVLLPFRAGRVLAVGPYRAPPEPIAPYRRGTVGTLVGRYGQYSADAFSQRRADGTNVLPPDSARAEDTLSRAMDAWWSYVLRDEIMVRVNEERRLGFSVRLETSGIADRSFGQVGFGLSQLWPILVAGLASRPGDLVIVETPEAHLHPGAQHRVARLFVELAKRNRQVIVETHSEHVVAAGCLAVKEAQLEPADLALSFFSQVRGETKVERIPVDGSGRKLLVPEGFFDQSARELLALLER
jgi:predicted ATPase